MPKPSGRTPPPIQQTLMPLVDREGQAKANIGKYITWAKDLLALVGKSDKGLVSKDKPRYQESDWLLVEVAIGMSDHSRGLLLSSLTQAKNRK